MVAMTSSTAQQRSRRRPIIRWTIIATVLMPVLAGLFHTSDTSYAYVLGYTFGVIAPIAIIAILIILIIRWIRSR